MAIRTDHGGSQSFTFVGPFGSGGTTYDALFMRIVAGRAEDPTGIRVQWERQVFLFLAPFHGASYAFARNYEMIGYLLFLRKGKPTAGMGDPWVAGAADPYQVAFHVESHLIDAGRILQILLRGVADQAGVFFYLPGVGDLVMGVTSAVMAVIVTPETEVGTLPIGAIAEEQGVWRLFSGALAQALGLDVVAGCAGQSAIGVQLVLEHLGHALSHGRFGFDCGGVDVTVVEYGAVTHVAELVDVAMAKLEPAFARCVPMTTHAAVLAPMGVGYLGGPDPSLGNPVPDLFGMRKQFLSRRGALVLHRRHCDRLCYQDQEAQ
jgi:hypothetical protein